MTQQGHYSEDDFTNPLSVYGKSKREGELAVIKSGCKHFIFRTSWVFASRGNNFAKTMIKLAREHDELKVVADQVGAPTSAELIADVTAQLVYQPRLSLGYAEQFSGIYNLVASGQTSWHGLAKHVIACAENLGLKLQVKQESIAVITTEQFPRPAMRTLNSRMNTKKLQSLLSIGLPEWQVHVDRVMREFIENQS